MSDYYVANEKVDLKCYPNYSFEIADVNGDNKKEFISMDQSGNLLRVLDLDGKQLFEQQLYNNGNWGTPLICAADIDNDGCDEVIVPSGGSIVALDKKGRKINERIFSGYQKDAFGICVPLLGTAKLSQSNEPFIIAAVAGGEVYAFDSKFNIIWKVEGLRREFGHEIHFADIDGDGMDEIAFCSVDNINEGPSQTNKGDLVILDHDGTILLRKEVADYINDTHFDDVAMEDFLGNRSCQILLEKGLLINLKGEVVWDLQQEMNHGQWISHAVNPKGPGKVCFISELWDAKVKGLLFSGQGKKIIDINNFPWPSVDPGIRLLPSRCHTVQWEKESEPEFFLTQQINVPGEFNCTQTRPYPGIAIFMDLQGNQTGQLPYMDSQIQGYYYNGEVHSRVADVDGDGQQEIVYPKQDGYIMIIKKRG